MPRCFAAFNPFQDAKKSRVRAILQQNSTDGLQKGTKSALWRKWSGQFSGPVHSELKAYLHALRSERR